MKPCGGGGGQGGAAVVDCEDMFSLAHAGAGCSGTQQAFQTILSSGADGALSVVNVAVRGSGSGSPAS